MKFPVSKFGFLGLSGFSDDFSDKGLKISISETIGICVFAVGKAVEKGFTVVFLEKSSLFRIFLTVSERRGEREKWQIV